MSSQKADRIQVPQLFIRYDLGKTAVYKRMADLKMERKKWATAPTSQPTN